MKLSRFELAAVKRTAQNTKTLVRTKSKLEEKMTELAKQILDINMQIDAWEKPIVDKWGYTSAQLIAMEGELPETNVVESAPVETVDAEPMGMPAVDLPSPVFGE